MKKKLGILIMSVFVLGVLFAFVSFSSVPLEAVDLGGPVMDSGAGTKTIYWYRTDEICINNPKKEKTHCEKDGTEQCKAQYCQ